MNRTLDSSPSILVVGGGVVGLSCAREFAAAGARVALLERGAIGRAASWAGAGILPPSSIEFARHPLERLAAESFRLHPVLAAELHDETDIDTGFRRCGGLFVARTAGEAAALAGQCFEWEESGVEVSRLSRDELRALAPEMTTDAICLAAMLPDESQIRNPDHLRALAESCRRRGVEMRDQAGSIRLLIEGNRLRGAETEAGESFLADVVCLAAGAWTAELLEPLGVRIGTLPVRGQMLLFRLPERIFSQVVYEGSRYLVPRDDGHVLVGSSLEQAGFDARTTSEVLESLQQFGQSLFAKLTRERRVGEWAGLRPGTFDGFPYIGRVPGFENAWTACGHYRNGLLMAPATAILLRQLIWGEEPMIDVTPFRLGRG
jgi:glycine oxidase